MIFTNMIEAKKWFMKFKPLSKEIAHSIPNFIDFEGEDAKWEFGEWILFQHIKYSYDKINPIMIGRPQFAIFTNYKIWDQALVINFIEKPRAWENHHEVITNPDINYSEAISQGDDKVDAIQFWTDNIKILGHWKIKPTISDLKLAMKKQI